MFLIKLHCAGIACLCALLTFEYCLYKVQGTKHDTYLIGLLAGAVFVP